MKSIVGSSKDLPDYKLEKERFWIDEAYKFLRKNGVNDFGFDYSEIGADDVHFYSPNVNSTIIGITKSPGFSNTNS